MIARFLKRHYTVSLVMIQLQWSGPKNVFVCVDGGAFLRTTYMCG